MKRSEQAALQKRLRAGADADADAVPAPPPSTAGSDAEGGTGPASARREKGKAVDFAEGTKPGDPGGSSGASSRAASPTAEDRAVDADGDAPMPDVSDAEAGFEPTADRPFRRTRRHTFAEGGGQGGGGGGGGRRREDPFGDPSAPSPFAKVSLSLAPREEPSTQAPAASLLSSAMYIDLLHLSLDMARHTADMEFICIDR